MTGIKIFSKLFTTIEEVNSINELSPFSLRLDIFDHNDINLKIYGVCSQSVSLWRTQSKRSFRSSLQVDRGQIHIRIPIKGSFHYEIGQGNICRSGAGTIIAASDTNPMVAGEEVDMICLELSRQKIELYLKRLLPFEFRFQESCTVLSFPRSSVDEFCEFLTRTHNAIVLTEGDLDIVYPLFEEMLMSKFRIFMSENFSSLIQVRKYDRVTEMALDFIKYNLKNKVHISEIANYAGVSVSTLEKRFKRDLAMSPIQYLLDKRLDLVHQEILESQKFEFVSQIAIRWGFKHMTDFSRRYKAKFGYLPSQTRARR